jgi:ankyrin repeat protein
LCAARRGTARKAPARAKRGAPRARRVRARWLTCSRARSLREALRGAALFSPERAHACLRASCGNPQMASYPLHAAASAGDTKLLRKLLEAGKNDVDAIDEEADCYAHAWSALHCAAGGGHADCLRLLIGAGAGVNNAYYGCTALHAAAAKGASECLSALLTMGAAVNAQETDHETALMYAAMNGHAECVRRLLDAGANTEVKQKYNGTALHYAVDAGHVECVRLLLAKGARTEARGEGGRKPLHLAASNCCGECSIECMRALLDAGADINAVYPRWSGDKSGTTPLMECAGGESESSRECARLLLERGADPDLKRDEKGPGIRELTGSEAVAALMGAMADSGSDDDSSDDDDDSDSDED